MDMGFTREHCIEALALTPSLEQATEFILTNRSADLESRTSAPPAAPAPTNVSDSTYSRSRSILMFKLRNYRIQCHVVIKYKVMRQ